METIVQKRVKNGWQSGKMSGRVEKMDGKVKHKMVRCINGWQGKKMDGRVEKMDGRIQNWIAVWTFFSLKNLKRNWISKLPQQQNFFSRLSIEL